MANSRCFMIVCMFSLIFYRELYVSADLDILPVGNFTVLENGTGSCFLAIETVHGQNTTILTASSSSRMCSVELTSLDAGIGTLVEIPDDTPLEAFLYVEKKGSLMSCQNRFVVITPNAHCGIVFQHKNLQLFVQGNTSVLIRELALNESSPVCANEDFVMSGLDQCHTREFNRTISCSAYSDHICVVELPSPDCNATLGNREVSFKCFQNTLHSNHRSLILYEDDIMNLNFSDGNVVEIDENAFVSLPTLEELDISYNKLSKVQVQAFTGLNNLTALNLRGNMLQTLSNPHLGGLVALTWLHLADNRLSGLPADLFVGLDKLIYLSLGGNDLTVLPRGLFKGLVNLQKLYLYGNMIGELDEDIFNETKKLSILSLFRNDLTLLPRGLFAGLTNLAELWLYRNKLTELPRGLFEGLSNLTQLYLDQNKLTVLPRGLFTGLVNLQVLWLEENEISEVDADIFNETNKLTRLVLSWNKLEKIPRGLFSGLTNLAELDLNKNQIREVDADLFKDTNNLIALFLAGNYLTVLPQGLFNGLENLDILSMYDNQISELDKDLLNETSKLTGLSLYGNNLSVLLRGILTGLSNFIILLVDGNQLRAVDGDLFNDTKNIIYVQLSRNKLQQLPKQLFRGLYNLRSLFLDQNELESLDSSLFQDTPKLQSLSLKFNNIVDLPYDIFWQVKSLFALSLDHNKISHLNHTIFTALQLLQVLSLSSNKLKSLDRLLLNSTTNLTFLESSKNQLIDIPDIKTLNQLSLLGLRDNPLTMIDKSTFDNLPAQAEIYADQVEVCECYVPNDVNCAAIDVRSPYLTCDRLLSDRVLMVMMWLIGLNAFGGNIYVLIRKKTKKEKKTVQTFLISNLALADFLMGVYMLIIASADIHFGHNFPMQAEAWRTGITCRIAGAISLISTEASVFFVTLISIDRFINIRFPFARGKLNQKMSVYIVISLWLIAFILGIVPSVLAGKYDRFYDNSQVCIDLPLAKIEMFSKNVSLEEGVKEFTYGWFDYDKYIVTSESLGYVPGLYYASAVFLGVNGISYFVILLCYIEIVRFVFETARRAGVNKDMEKQIKMTMRVAAIVLTDFSCLAPIIVMGILVQMDVVVLPASVFAWSVACFLPINSALNPYLYTISNIIANRREQKRKHDENKKTSGLNKNDGNQIVDSF